MKYVATFRSNSLFSTSSETQTPISLRNLQEIRRLFPSDHNPFYAGFGNRNTDVLSYMKMGIPKGKIFIINPKVLSWLVVKRMRILYQLYSNKIASPCRER